MNSKTWLVLVIITTFTVILFGKVLFTNHQMVDVKNITEQKIMKIESDIFVNNGYIPVLYTCDGEGKQPPLKISSVPIEAKSLAFIVDDPDAPNGDFVHWVIWNINPQTLIIENGKIPLNSVEGYTSLNKPGWIAPCPPSGIHHYNFKLYALNTILTIPKFSNKTDLVQAMGKHIIDNATLVGLYGRK